jgi:hypothetical protein
LTGVGKPADQWHGEVFRLLLEFLNAAHSLTARVNEMAALSGGGEVPPAGPLATFMEEIRTCMKHRTTPRMTLQHFASPAPKLRVLQMHVQEMLSWPHWSEPARRFIHHHQPDLSLFTAVHEYQQTMRMFRLRAERQFRSVFEEIVASAPCPLVMMPMMM